MEFLTMVANRHHTGLLNTWFFHRVTPWGVCSIWHSAVVSCCQHPLPWEVFVVSVRVGGRVLRGPSLAVRTFTRVRQMTRVGFKANRMAATSVYQKNTVLKLYHKDQDCSTTDK